MKSKTMMMLALAAITAGAVVNAENTNAAPKAQTQVAAPAAQSAEVRLSADEQAFAAKLSDQNRKMFAEKLSVEQKRSVMVAVKNGANADEAVQKMIAAKEVKEASTVANVEKTPSAQAK